MPERDRTDRVAASPSRPVFRRRPDGGATTVELVLLMPLVMLLSGGVIQFALYLFARQVASSAAQAGARVARIEAETNPAWRVQARQTAAQRIDQLGSTMLDNVQITAITPGSDLVGVQIEADVPNLWPDFLVPDIRVTSAGPIERFIPDV